MADNIPVVEKYERWLDWKGSFDIALTVCDGTPTDQQKVGLLFTSVGTETQKNIKLLGLPPMHSGGWEGDEYNTLSRGLNNFFRGMVDETVDFARYHDAEQAPNEDIHRYTMRLRELALGINVNPASFAFRHQLLKGMRNRELAAKAADDNIPLGELIPIAAQKEQREASEAKQKVSEPCQTKSTVQTEFAAVAEYKKIQGFKRPAPRDSKEPQSKSRSCRYCGGRPHTSKKRCPAYNKTCRGCGKPNHFEKVCEAKKADPKVNVLNSGDAETEPQVLNQSFLSM